MPCDAFTSVEDNIAALAGHIEAARKIDRYRAGTVEQMFAGFQAIRGPGERPWREVLGIRPEAPVNREAIRASRDELAKRHHPDVDGGTTTAWQRSTQRSNAPWRNSASPAASRR
jgi:hypothetical protein